MPALHQIRGKGGSGDPPDSNSPTHQKPRDGWWRRNDISVVIGIVIAVLALVAIWPSIFVVIPSGHAGV